MSKTLIVAAGKTAEGEGCLQPVLQLEQKLKQIGLPPRELVIEPLSTGWHAPRQEDHFRSGCAPIEALAKAKALIEAGTAAVVIRGEDNLKTGYSREQRHQLMAIYGDEYPITQAYDDLAHEFARRQGIDADTFRELCQQLYSNYECSYRNVMRQPVTQDERWFQPLTSLFRGVDCANPLVDFHGRLLLCSQETAQLLDIPATEVVEVKGVGLGFLEQDGPQQLRQIADYEHLGQAWQQADQQAGGYFKQKFSERKALLESYTCYPVVPMALMLKSGLVSGPEQLAEFVARYPLTVTGGMNLAKGPWNNPALNGLISMYQALLQSDASLGAVHGNGGLGYRQGVAMLATE
ncbi:beta-ketoacyl-[acyl-carrier-protein] synthase family protein [Marinobacterium jannaschii]|uniref:hypothetical protein n=1 Tax=Marinobacterium jannaschii TaxID=64970 RepID=UPI0004873438|nr:hypothetical protein [Marinobacterium jannaschii]